MHLSQQARTALHQSITHEAAVVLLDTYGTILGREQSVLNAFFPRVPLHTSYFKVKKVT